MRRIQGEGDNSLSILVEDENLGERQRSPLFSALETSKTAGREPWELETEPESELGSGQSLGSAQSSSGVGSTRRQAKRLHTATL